jgi:casein kinase 1
MPKEIITYVKYCRELEFEQKPDYDYLRSLFENILKKNGLYNDLHFSWIKDLSILKSDNNQSKISQLNIKKRKASPQSRIFRKLEKSRQVSKEKEKENETSTQKKNNFIKNIIKI